MMFRYSSLISRCVKNVQNNSGRPLSYQSIKQLWSIYFGKMSKGGKPPYNHICQIGDPVLRKMTEPVDLKAIETEEFQKGLDQLYKMMRKYHTMGLAAPQIGYPWRVFAIEVTEEELKDIESTVRIICGMEPQPLIYFVNPKLTVINYHELVFQEVCASIQSYHAQVPRPMEIEIKALDRFGKPFTWRAKNWLARIALHENDHLYGVLYTDRMLPLSFEYSFWENYNENNGRVVMK
ncbi:peptide deformylase, mitochondrial [Xylocopa sonorina]|uniref:peptide deformylase, mitochondrial n=1 Tax=Xylocopa sonorina TaxID=1818115 RepID=UPI00403ACA2B